MSFTKAVMLAILSYLVLPLAKDYIEQNHFVKPSAYEAYHSGGEGIGNTVNR